jgi:predicted ArsR family transcriptional regulator
VARVLLDGGPQTAASLAERLALTGTAVRRHLDSLVAAGHVVATERAPYGPGAGQAAPRGRGRPARIYTLTALGRDAFAQAYDHLAVSALSYLDSAAGSQEGAAGFARHHAEQLKARYAGVRDAENRPQALADALTADGYAATVFPGALGVQVCQHHCPIGHVAEVFPQLCEAETEAFGDLLGTHVTRLATLAAGDGVCTTLVPPTGGASSTTAPRKDTP